MPHSMATPARALKVMSGALSRSGSAALLVFLGLLIVNVNGGSIVSQAYALGLGSANADSYIGEPLIVRIPLFNVNNPDQLAVGLSNDQGSAIDGETQSFSTNANLSASIERANSQLGVLIRSSDIVTEPYINFTIKIFDGQASFIKEYTVLFNLAPAGYVPSSGSSNGQRITDQSQSLNSRQVVTEPLGSSANGNDFFSRANNNNNDRSVRNDGSILGPYDFAEANNIPEKFGAVLDGQSLWRVARRINEALGVSIEQAMISLYKNNPEAFSSDSVDSLKAGVFLNIPSRTQASALSNAEAKRALDSLSSGSGLPADTNNNDSQAFQLTAIDEVISESTGAVTNLKDFAQGEGSDDSINGQKAQEIISSLAQTVGNLTQELIRKDNQIKFLTEKVEALEAYANIDADTLVNVPSEYANAEVNLSALEGSSSVEEPLPVEDSLSVEDSLPVEDSLSVEDSAPVKEPLSVEDSLPVEDSLSVEDSIEGVDEIYDSIPEEPTDAELAALVEEANSKVEEVNSKIEEAPVPAFTEQVEQTAESENQSFFGKWWAWIVSVPLLLLGLLALLFRERTGELLRSLNFFGSNDSVEFNEPAIIDLPIDYRESKNNRGDFSALSSRAKASKPVVIPEYEKVDPPELPESDSAEDDEVEVLEFEPYSEAATKDDSEFSFNDGDVSVNENLAYEDFVTADEDIEVATSNEDQDTELIIEMGAIPGVGIELDDSVEQDMDFSDRFENLLEQKDFDFARELLDFARHNEIDEDRYHCERLVLFHAMKDEEGFYDYYYEIESKVGNFNQDLQTRISQLVVELAQK